MRRGSPDAIDFRARLKRLRGVLHSPEAPKLVAAILGVALAAESLHLGFDVHWAVTAGARSATPAPGKSGAGSIGAAPSFPALQRLVNAHLFGLAPAAGERLAAAAAQRDTTLVLTGTVATSDPSSGFALIGTSAEAARVHPVGDSLASGAVLRAVYRDHVIVERAGQLSAVFFPRTGKAVLTMAAIRSHSSAAQGERDDVDSEQLQRQHIEEAIEAESEHTAAFVRQQPFYSDGQLRGIALEPGGDPAMLARLGIKAGDVLEFVDGLPIAQEDRLAWLRQRLQSGQSVDLSVIRPGSGEIDVKIPGGAVAGMIEN